MKICFLAHNLWQDNGAGVFSRRHITELSRALPAEIVVLTTLASGESNEHALIHASRLALLRELPKIRRLIKQCDVVHALDIFPYGFIAALASIGLGKKLIITAIGTGSIHPLNFWRYAPFMRWAYRRAAAVTAISAFTRDEILKKMPELKITVINPGIDITEFSANSNLQPVEAKTFASTTYNLQAYKPYILGVGQLRWRKGYHFSIRSFAKIADRFPDLHYVIVGKRYTDVYDRRLKNLIAELGLGNRVHILQDVPSRTALAEIYKNAELFCLFSQNILHDVEGFGIVFLEAAAAGLPVVGSKNCGIDDAVEDGKNGILVSTRDPDDFADAIAKILRDKKLKGEMGARSLAFARTMSWEKHVSAYVTLYHRL